MVVVLLRGTDGEPFGDDGDGEEGDDDEGDDDGGDPQDGLVRFLMSKPK